MMQDKLYVFRCPFKRTLTVLAYKKKTFFSAAECWLVSSNATRLKNAINYILREKARKRRVDSGPEKRGDCNWSIFPLLLLTSTIWFSLDHKRSQKKMETFWFLRLRFRRAYDSAYDSDFLFSQGHKRSYDSAYDSDANSDSVANANHPLTCHFVKN